MRWLALVALATIAAPAQAQINTPAPYTFTVPLHLANVPETTRVRVSCYVSRLGIDADGGVAENNLVARGETIVTVTGGAFDGDVTVPTVNRVAASSQPASYLCNYNLMGPSAGGGTFSAGDGNSYAQTTRRQITSSVSRVTDAMH